jgi:formylmethanofuran dehydrogenase subunit A
MFALPRHVIKAGAIAVEDGEVRSAAIARTLHVAPGYDRAIESELSDWFARDYTIRMANYPVTIEEIANPLECPKGGVS